jgi:hypothetical protein
MENFPLTLLQTQDLAAEVSFRNTQATQVCTYVCMYVCMYDLKNAQATQVGMHVRTYVRTCVCMSLP